MAYVSQTWALMPKQKKLPNNTSTLWLKHHTSKFPSHFWTERWFPPYLSSAAVTPTGHTFYFNCHMITCIYIHIYIYMHCWEDFSRGLQSASCTFYFAFQNTVWWDKGDNNKNKNNNNNHFSFLQIKNL